MLATTLTCRAPRFLPPAPPTAASLDTQVCLLASTGLLFKLFGLPSDSSGQAAHDKLGVPASALSKLLSLVPGLSEVLGAASAVRGAAADLVSDALTFVVAYVLLEYARESGLLPPQLLALVGDGGAAGTASRQFDEQ